MKRELDLPTSIKEAIAGTPQEFYAKVEHLADQAFDDQCTGANPRYPLITDLKQLLEDAYEGAPVVDESLFSSNGNGNGHAIGLADVKADPQPVV